MEWAVVQEECEEQKIPPFKGMVCASSSSTSANSSGDEGLRLDVDEIFRRFEGRSIPVQALVSFFEEKWEVNTKK